MSMVNENQSIRPQSAINAPVRPRIPNIDNFTQDKLFQIANDNNSSSAAFQCLIELVRRTTEKNEELSEKVTALEQEVKKVTVLEQEIKNLQIALNPPKKRCGRKAKEFFIHGKMLDDEYLVYLIDNMYFTIRELEKEVGANKNQLRRRYERCKAKEERKG